MIYKSKPYLLVSRGSNFLGLILKDSPGIENITISENKSSNIIIQINIIYSTLSFE